MSFDIIFCNPSCMHNVLYKQEWNSSFESCWHTTLYTFSQNATQNKTKCCIKKYGATNYAPWYKNVQVQTKPNCNRECLQAFSFNHGGGEDSLSEPSSSSSFYYYYYDPTMMDLSRPSIEKYQKTKKTKKKT